MLTKYPKEEMKIHPVTAKVKVEKGFNNLESHKPFCSYYSSIPVSTIISKFTCFTFLVIFTAPNKQFFGVKLLIGLRATLFNSAKMPGLELLPFLSY